MREEKDMGTDKICDYIVISKVKRNILKRPFCFKMTRLGNGCKICDLGEWFSKNTNTWIKTNFCAKWSKFLLFKLFSVWYL